MIRNRLPFPRALRPFALAALALAWAAPVTAAESYENCTGFIDSLPVEISSQGTWCLRHDASTALTSGAAITINTNNVTIDCNDFKLGGLSAGTATMAIGIHAVGRSNVVVRHCSVRGFYRGIYLVSGPGGHVVEDNRLDNNTRTGIRVDGDGSVVRRNLVRDTGGTTVTVGSANAIITTGDIDIVDNTVVGVLPGVDGSGNGNAFGIRADNSTGGTVEHNRVRGLVSVGPTGGAYAILLATGNYNSVRNNHVVGPGSTGLACPGTTDGAIGNTVYAFETSIAGCADEGGNVMK
ncbi:right-handed parallel beta-helix repeat-containing protein [Agrilutibacter solisilvae]|uniref:Right-handed parallel beta-helix repeat-containing protein n=1 Tax=Agrilutibacter solisilvae TaxID=2763317 RepID=A0A974Y1Q9_9GAMM|nr:right-handed parallel beta-helix repeat-containing protein [Lysobacter solisilvae]QSX79694.1 right-handed parallel beta-helix repeat-containing protein [Lysobacter solisilvae]